MKKRKLTLEQLFALSYKDFKKELQENFHQVPIKDKTRYMEKMEESAFHWIREQRKNDDLLRKLTYIDTLRTMARVIIKKHHERSLQEK